jgi:hypothetical protein
MYFIRVLDTLSTGKIENIQCLLNKYDNIYFICGDTSNIDVI